MEKPTIICLTPVRNEAWILDMFLQCTSLWADYIIIADQNSTDGSREIAKKYPKVILVDNISKEYNEFSRQILLLEEARKIKGKRLLISLDADEIFTSDFLETNDWQRIINSNKGDSFSFRWVNIKPNMRNGWLSNHFPWALMDDEAPHGGKWIHSPRLPITNPENTQKLEQIKVLHYQYTNWRRMKSKHRYYQCLERLNNPTTNPIYLYRTYHHMDSVKKKDLIVLDNHWFQFYEENGIAVREIKFDSIYWFDEEVLKLFSLYGTQKFRNEAIWNVNWNKIASLMSFGKTNDYCDPRNLFNKMIHVWLNISHPFHKKYLIKKVDSLLMSHINY